MARVTGLGGVFFRAGDREGLVAWYRRHLGLPIAPGGWHILEWRERDDPSKVGSTVWALFPQDTSYFGASKPTFMLNYRVDDLDAMLAQLRAAGVTVDERTHQDEKGRFGWATDPEGNRIELWQPAPAH
jgi:catechol 2,3-dioxygenase-like lactoylglutathione lyase family enzyme